MTGQIIYGSSDDLIEMEGDIYDEHGEYNAGVLKFSLSDGTTGTIEYGEKGTWDIDIINAGKLYIGRRINVGENGTHQHPYEKITPYSDIAIFDPGITWIKIGKEKYSK